MSIYKNEDTNTWYVICWFTDWRGERKQKCKRGFATKRAATESSSGVGTTVRMKFDSY